MSVMSYSVRPHRQQPTRLPYLGFSRQAYWSGLAFPSPMQESESEVAQSHQSCPTLHDPLDCNPPGSSIHGISQARVLEWGAIAFSINACKLILGLFDNLDGWEAGGRVIMEGTYVYLWLIHVDV